MSADQRIRDAIGTLTEGALVRVAGADVAEVAKAVPNPDQTVKDLRAGCSMHRPGQFAYIQAGHLQHLLNPPVETPAPEPS